MGYGSVPKTTWPGEDVWLIGGGPSSVGFNYAALNGRRAIYVNDAVRQAPQEPSSIVFSVDPQWMLRNHALLTDFPGAKYLAVPLETFPGCGGIPGAVYLRWAHGGGLSDDHRYIKAGGHSGYGALGLAYLKRPRRIFLVGYDLNTGSSNAYDSQYPFWAVNYRGAVPQLKKRGIEVFNCNPGSAIDAFPFVDPDSALLASLGDPGVSTSGPGAGNRI